MLINRSLLVHEVHKIIYVYIYSCNLNYGGVTVLKIKTLETCSYKTTDITVITDQLIELNSPSCSLLTAGGAASPDGV